MTLDLVGPDDVHKRSLLVLASGVESLALSSTSLASNQSSQIELHSGRGNIELILQTEKTPDGQLIGSQLISRDSVQHADQLLGAVSLVIDRGLEDQVGGGSAEATTAVASSSAASGSQVGALGETDASGGLQTQQTQTGGGDGDSTGEDGLGEGEEEGGDDGQAQEVFHFYGLNVKC